MGLYRRILMKRRLILFVSVMLMLIGVLSYLRLPRQEFPEIDAPAAVITALYPGASAETVRREVTDPLQNALLGIAAYDYTSSVSRDSVSVVVLRLDVDADMTEITMDLRDRLDSLEPSLPDGVTEIQLNTDLVDTADVYYMLLGTVGDETELDVAEMLRNRCYGVSGVSKVTTLGDVPLDTVIRVQVGQANDLGITMGVIVASLQEHLAIMPVGDLELDGSTIDLEMARIIDLDTLLEIPLLTNPLTHSRVLLGDVADVFYRESQNRVAVRYNGEDGILLAVYFNPEEDAVSIGERLGQTLSETALPDGFSLVKVHDAPENIALSLRRFNLNFLTGIVLVLATVLFGMGLRNALVVSMAIPMSVMITFATMGIADIRIHQISIAALIISLGMLVDNAIVISDAVQVRIDAQGNSLTSIAQGVGEVGIPVLTSTLTTVFAFAPLLMLGGVAGEYIHSLPTIIIAALLASYAVSVLFTPLLSVMLLRPGKADRRIHRARQAAMDLLGYFLRHRRQLLVLLILLALGAGVTVFRMGLQFFPYADTDIVYLNLRAEAPQDPDNTLTKALQAETLLLEEPAIQDVLVSVGTGLPKFYNTLLPMGSSEDVAQFYIRIDMERITDGSDSLEAYLDVLQRKLENVMSGVDLNLQQLEQGEPIGSPIRLIVRGENREILREETQSIKQAISSVNGVTTVSDDLRLESLRYDVTPREDRLRVYGITESDVRTEIGLLAGTYPLDETEIGGQIRRIAVEGNLNSLSDLKQAMVYTPAGQLIPVGSLVDFGISEGVSRINQYERMEAITIYGEIDSGSNPRLIERAIREKIEALDLTSDIIYDGEMGKIVQYFGDIGVLALFSAMLILVILLVQFNSLKKVLLILITIPISSIGSIFGLALAGYPLSFTSLFGMVSLFGIVVNNAIVLLDFITKEIKAGHPLRQAVEQAVMKRYRPIMLTTLTTVIGLLPLAFSGSALFEPMATALIAGLSFSTLLTLVVIPVIFTLMFPEQGDPKAADRIQRLNGMKEAIWKET